MLATPAPCSPLPAFSGVFGRGWSPAVVSGPARIRDSPAAFAQRTHSRRRLHGRPPGHQRQRARRPGHLPERTSTRFTASGNLLPLVEWTFIFIPILFHAIVGVAIVAGMVPNTGNYPYGANRRYTLQRWTGMIAFVFIVLPRVPHARLVPFRRLADERRRAVRRRRSSGRTTPPRPPAWRCRARSCWCSMRSACWPACSTWPTACGRWASPGACGPVPPAQPRALQGVRDVRRAAGRRRASARWAACGTPAAAQALEKAVEVENRMYEHRVEAGELEPNEHKRAVHETAATPNRTNSRARRKGAKTQEERRIGFVVSIVRLVSFATLLFATLRRKLTIIRG